MHNIMMWDLSAYVDREIGASEDEHEREDNEPIFDADAMNLFEDVHNIERRDDYQSLDELISHCRQLQLIGTLLFL